MSLKLGFWIPILKRIPDSLSYISDSKARHSAFQKQIFPDSEFHQQKFLGFRNLDSLIWVEKVNMSTAASPRPPSLGRFRAGIHLGNLQFNREEKSLRHVAKVAKFLDDNKPKNSHLKLFLTSSILFSFN